ncbi:MAG TPA: thioesterase family protein [Fimbriimonadaceae bacterium]|nr:thioesterase family protein [Fimbriimonadaceae bacterium]
MLNAVTEERIRVRYGETDQMGHAYYSNYLLWYEQARGAWCRDRGFTYKSMEAQGYKIPAVEVWSRYKGEVKYDDTIVVRVSLTEIKRSAFKFEYQIINETTGQECTSGYTWHVLAAGDPIKAISIPAEVRELLERDPSQFDRLA